MGRQSRPMCKKVHGRELLKSMNGDGSAEKLFIVIPVHNRREYTRTCLDCLARQSVSGFHVIVIDDGSTDGTNKMIRAEFPGTILLQGDGNLWWAESVNIGVRYALEHDAVWILTLNDDTEPPTEFVEKLLARGRSCPQSLIGAGAASVSIGEIVYSGERINWITGRHYKVPFSDDVGLVEVTHFPGRGLLIPAEVFRRQGVYDSKHFPQMAADVDLTFRAARAGYRLYCDQSNVLPIHVESCTGGHYISNRSLKNYWNHLFAIKGGANLRVFFWLAVKNCPRKFLLFYLPIGIFCRVLGYWKLRRK